jgi:hypothetical protein
VAAAGRRTPACLFSDVKADKILLHIEVANGLAQLDGTAKKKNQE